MPGTKALTKKKLDVEMSFVIPTLDESDGSDLGGFCTYFKIGMGLGLKVIHTYYDVEGENHCAGVAFSCPSTPQELRATDLWKRSHDELRLLEKAQHLSYVPRSYGLVPVPMTGFMDCCGDDHEGVVWLPGIIMEHIVGVDLIESCPDMPTRLIFIDSIHRQVKKDGLILKDHDMGSNILVELDDSVKPWGVKRWWIIDFTPGLIEVVRRRKKSD